MRTLLLDIGNSRIKWGVLDGETDGETIQQSQMLAHSSIAEHGLPTVTTQLPHDIDSIFACNVADETLATRLLESIAAHCGSAVRLAQSEPLACGVRNGYQEPHELGVDRWLALLAARSRSDRACLVVDAGTALTIDAMTDDGRHLGGQILPGLRLMAVSLASSTSDLPQINWSDSDSSMGSDIFASTTENAISQGIIGAAVGAIERTVRKLRHANIEPTIFVTGGDAPLILKALERDAVHRPHLVLEGLACRLKGQNP